MSEITIYLKLAEANYEAYRLHLEEKYLVEAGEAYLRAVRCVKRAEKMGTRCGYVRINKVYETLKSCGVFKFASENVIERVCTAEEIRAACVR